MNRVELEAYVSERTSIPKEVVSTVVGETLDTMANSLSAGGTVRIVGYFTMSVKDRPERIGKNPKTGETINIPASRRISFKPGKKIIDALAGS